MELHGEGDQDQVSIRSLPMIIQVSGSPLLLMLLGKEPNNMFHVNALYLGTHCLSKPWHQKGLTKGAVPGTAVLSPKGSVSLAAGGEMTSRSVRETLEDPGVEDFISDK